MTTEELADAIAREINGWDESELKAHFDNDGDGRLDFYRYQVTDFGRLALLELLQKKLSTG